MENVFHGEPAARIAEEVAQDAANIRWAEDVQHNIEASTGRQHMAEAITVLQGCSGTVGQQREDEKLDGREGEEQTNEKVHLLRFGCNDTEAFRKLLLEGTHMKRCRDLLDKAGSSCHLPGGALMFVKPDQCQDVRRALDGVELCSFHVIVTSSFESDLEDALASLPYRRRPREKAQHRREVSIPTKQEPDSEAEDQEAQDVSSYELSCKRTFLCYAPTLKKPEAVVQSTTEAVSSSASAHYNSFRGVNPRRFA